MNLVHLFVHLLKAKIELGVLIFKIVLGGLSFYLEGVVDFVLEVAYLVHYDLDLLVNSFV